MTRGGYVQLNEWHRLHCSLVYKHQELLTYLVTYLFSLLPRRTAGIRPVSTPIVSTPPLPPLVSLEDRPSSRSTRRCGLGALTSSSAVTSTDDGLLLVCTESLATSPVRQALSLKRSK